MPRWTAAQLLTRIALEKPLKLREWRSDMDGKILPAQLKLHEAIVQGRITDVRGRRGPPGSKERIEELLSDSEFTLLVTPHGTLTIHPPHKRLKFIEKYGIDPNNWVREIDFDQDEGEQAFSASLAPCQGQPDRSHLRLVSGGLPARSGEIEAPGSEPAARSSEEPPVEQLTYAQLAGRWGCSTEAARHRVARRHLPCTRGGDGKTLVAVSPQELLQQLPSTRSPDGDRPVNARSPGGDAPTADTENQVEAAAAAAETAATQPKERRGTTGRPRETRDAAAKKMRAELSHPDLRKRLTPDELRNMKQVALAKRYDCGRETACKARNDVLSEIVGNRVSDK